MEFAHCPPLKYGFSGTDKEREEEITRCLKKIDWTHPDTPRTKLSDQYRVEAVVILRRPRPSFFKAPKRSFLENLLISIGNLFRKAEPEEPQDSLIGFANAQAWVIFEISLKETLKSSYVKKQAAELQKDGFDIEVLVQSTKKLKPRSEDPHHLTIDKPHIVAKSFAEFCRMRAPVTNSSF